MRSPLAFLRSALSLSNFRRAGRSRPAAPAGSARRKVLRGLELLEDRTVLSTISWDNRGNGDNFDAFGANEDLAREIVDRAIADWEQVIEDFNYADGSNTFHVEITADEGFPGLAVIDDTDNLGKPTFARIYLDPTPFNDWYFDSAIGEPSLPDDSEYGGELLTPFASFLGWGAMDFYTGIVHELGHVLGVATSHGDLAIHDFVSSDPVMMDPNNPTTFHILHISQIDDEYTVLYPMPDMPGFYYCMNLGDYLYEVVVDGEVIGTLTTAGSGAKGGHFYEGPYNDAVAANGLTAHPHDALNDGRTWNGPRNERRLISDHDASFLAAVYDYTVNEPSQINTFYANFNSLNGEIEVQGDPDDSDDDIRVDIYNNKLRIRVNGTSELFNIDAVNVIDINSGDGDDLIRIDELPAGIHAIAYGNLGEDVIRLAYGSGHLEDIQGDVSISGGGQFDLAYLHDQNHSGGEAYTVTAGSITRTGMGGHVNYNSLVERILLSGEKGDSEFFIQGAPMFTRLDLDGGDGDDEFNFGMGNAATMTDGTHALLGGTGENTLIYDDHAAATNGSYDLTAVSLGRIGAGIVQFDYFQQVVMHTGQGDDATTVSHTPLGAEIELHGNAGDDAFYVNRIHATSSLTVRGNDDDDSIIVGQGDLDFYIKGDLAVDGGGGDDTLLLADTSDTGNDSYTIGAFSFSKTGTDVWSYAEVEDLVLAANNSTNTVTVGALSSIEASIFAGGGNDTIHLAGGLLAVINGDVTVDGGTGNDVVYVNNQNDAAGAVYTFFGHYLDVTGNFGLLDYTSIATLVVNAGTGSDTLDIQGTPEETVLTINAGGGDDLFEIGDGDLDPIGGTVVANGGPGSDLLVVNDSDDTGADSYKLVAALVKKTGFQVNYSGIEGLALHANAFDNLIEIDSTLPLTPVTVDSGAGADTIHVAGATKLLSAIKSLVTVDGNRGTDRLYVHDSANIGGPSPYTVTHDTVTTDRFELRFTNIERLSLLLGILDDIVHVTSLELTQVFLETGDGADTVYVHAADVGPIGDRKLVFNGGKGSDRLFVYYSQPEPLLEQKDPDKNGAGMVGIDYGKRKFLIEFVGVEALTVSEES